VFLKIRLERAVRIRHGAFTPDVGRHKVHCLDADGNFVGGFDCVFSNHISRHGAEAALVVSLDLLVLANELSNKSGVLAAQVPGLPRTEARRTIEPNKDALLATTRATSKIALDQRAASFGTSRLR
jgi:hypothetical protein